MGIDVIGALELRRSDGNWTCLDVDIEEEAIFDEDYDLSSLSEVDSEGVGGEGHSLAFACRKQKGMDWSVVKVK